MIVRVIERDAERWLRGELNDGDLCLRMNRTGNALYVVRAVSKRRIMFEMANHLKEGMPGLIVFRAHTNAVFRFADTLADLRGLDEVQLHRERKLPFEYDASVRFGIDVRQNSKAQAWLQRLKSLWTAKIAWSEQSERK